MERPSGPRPPNDAYEKVAHDDPELSSDEETITTAALPSSWSHSLRRRKPRTLLSTLWLCTRIIFITASILAWAASLWLTHLASRELARARALIPEAPSNSGPAHSTPDAPHHHPEPHHPAFIPGGTLPAAGYGLAYNTSYCNGWADPAGATARGCVLDPSQGGWIHALCHDAALLAEWRAQPDFGWYLDAGRTARVPQERVWAADVPGGVGTTLYTARAFHVQHCRFVMRLRIKHGMRRDRGLGYIPLDPGHMNHCLQLMAEGNASEAEAKELTQVVLGGFGGGTKGFGLGGECYMPVG